MLNLFALGHGATVVDLPGYGYAKVPTREKAGWQSMIERYLTEREALRLLVVLVDGEIGPTPLDVQMLLVDVLIIGFRHPRQRIQRQAVPDR